MRARTWLGALLIGRQPYTITPTADRAEVAAMSKVLDAVVTEQADHARRLDAICEQLDRLRLEPPRVERCDGLCTGDGCRMCARDHEMAGVIQDLANRVEVLEIALGAEHVKNRELRGHK